MTEQTPQTAPTGDAGPGNQQDNGGNPTGEQNASPWSPPASQAELDRIIGDRLARERAKFGDYETLQEKASRLDELEEAKKTAEQKQTEALTVAEKRAATAEAALIRAQVQASAGLTDDDMSFIHGATREELEAAAEKFITRTGLLAEQRQAAARRGPAPDPTQGRSGSIPAGSPQEAFAQFMQSQLQKG